MKSDIILKKNNIQITKAKQLKRRSGVNLIELMAVTAILATVVLGTSGYRYCAAQNARWCQEQISAARLGQLLCGNWAGVKGNETYDPTTLYNANLKLEALTPTKSLPSTFVLLGEYRITFDGVAYDCTLAWKDISTDLRALWINVEWDWRQQDPSNADKSLRKQFIVMTYV